MKRQTVFAVIVMGALAATVRADAVWTQPQSPTGSLVASSWVSPDGTDADRYAWENFTLSAPASITEIQWQGSGAVTDFTIVINPSYTGPDPNGAFARYDIAGNAGQTPAGIINGSQRYTYHYVLPTPLALAAGTNYYINIEGWGSWAISQGSGGNGSHVDFIVGLAMFLPGPGDLAITLIGSGPPSITVQPSPQAVCAGSNASFTVASSSPGPLTYQWRKASTILVDDAHLTGSQTPTLHISGAASIDAGAYSCLVTGAQGTTASVAATLTVGTTPVITIHPTAQSGCVGATIVLNANATSALAQSIQWRLNGAPITGATHVPYAFFASTALAGSYDCLFTNACGSSATDAVTVTANTAAVLVQQPASTGACAGGMTSFAVGASNSGSFGYAWRLNSQAINLAENPSAATPMLVINPVSAGSIGSYDCIVSSACGNTLSGSAMLAVFGALSGDASGDGVVDGRDIQAFANELVSGPDGAASLSRCAADINVDGQLDPNDVPLFVSALLGA